MNTPIKPDIEEIKKWLAKLKIAHEEYAKSSWERKCLIYEKIDFVFAKLESFGYNRSWLECLFMFGPEFLQFERDKFKRLAQREIYGVNPNKQTSPSEGTQTSLL